MIVAPAAESHATRDFIVSSGVCAEKAWIARASASLSATLRYRSKVGVVSAPEDRELIMMSFWLYDTSSSSDSSSSLPDRHMPRSLEDFFDGEVSPVPEFAMVLDGRLRLSDVWLIGGSSFPGFFSSHLLSVFSLQDCLSGLAR